MSTSPTEASAPKASIGRQVAFGAAWVMAGAMAGKAVGMGVQVVLGWVLVPEDFAIYAAALGLNLVAAALLDGGAERFLLRSGDSYGRVIAASTRIAYLANGLAGLAVLGIAAWAWWWRGDAVLAGVLGVMAVHAATRTPVSMLRTRLRHAMRFGTVARTEVVAIVFRGVLSVVLALSGLGAFAFVIPLVASLPVEWALLARQAKTLPKPACDGRADSVLDVLRSTRWIVAANTALTLAGRGDYLALTIAAPKVLGVYFFGFQLAVASMQLFMASFRSVLLPGLTGVGDDPVRLRAAARRAIGTVNLLLPPVCAALALLSPALVHLVWDGRWDESIVVVQAVALSTAVRAASPVGFALMEVHARWVRVAVLNAVDGASLIAVVFVGASIFGEDLAALVWLVAVQRALIGVTIQCSALRLIGVRPMSMLRWLGPGILALATGVLAVWFWGHWPSSANIDLADGVIGLSIFLAGWSTFVAVFERGQLRWGLELLRRRGRPRDPEMERSDD
jgi:O-antigen/teichoic acid export membrane protein